MVFFFWITNGREIENYLSIDIIKNSLNIESNILFNKFEDIKNVLNSLGENLGNKFEADKVKYAKIFIENMTIDNCKSILDLDSNMKKVVKIIENWN